MTHVTEKAIVSRINRKLAKENLALRKTRGTRQFLDCGDYYVVDLERNCVWQSHVMPLQIAQEYGVSLT